MRKLTCVLVLAAGLLLGCGGSGTGAIGKSIDFSAIAGTYNATYTSTNTGGGSDSGSGSLNVSSSGGISGTLTSSGSGSNQVTVTGTATSDGAFTGQAVTGESTDTLTGTIQQESDTKLIVEVTTSSGSHVVVTLTKASTLDLAALAGTYSATYTSHNSDGSTDSGTGSFTISSAGSVSGTLTSGSSSTVSVSGTLVSSGAFTGTADNGSNTKTLTGTFSGTSSQLVGNITVSNGNTVTLTLTRIVS